MPTLEFKGKQHIYAHHLTVPYRPLVPDPGRSLNPVDADDNLIIHGDNLNALKAPLPATPEASSASTSSTATRPCTGTSGSICGATKGQPGHPLAPRREHGGHRRPPPPDVIADEILEDLRAALEQLEEIAGDLGPSPSPSQYAPSS